MRFFITALLFLPVTLSAQIRDTVLVGRTRDALTPLYYSLGTDRLGGTRLETLDSGVVLNLSGRTDTHWRVRLAPDHTAYVPVSQIIVDSLRSFPTNVVTGSWRVWGDERYDYVSVALPARLPYASQQQISPGRIVVDIFGAASNSNWLTQLSSAKEIRNVWYEQVSDEVFRVYIELNHSTFWGHSIYYVNNGLMIRVRRPPTKRRLRGLTIAIDAGHGGSNPGARGRDSGQLEKDLTLDVARRLRRRLERSGARVLMTRDRDTSIGPTDRIRAMRKVLPDLLVSIHFNSSGNRQARGVSTYYKHLGFRPLSQAILTELRRLDPHEFGNVGGFNFFFNAPTDYPNVLVEGPFLSNPDDETLAISERYREGMARRIRKGLKRFLKR